MILTVTAGLIALVGYVCTVVLIWSSRLRPMRQAYAPYSPRLGWTLPANDRSPMIWREPLISAQRARQEGSQARADFENLLGLIAYAIAWGATGISAILVGSQPILSYFDSTTWVSTVATVQSAEATQVPVGGRSSSVIWTPDFSYEYDVDGVSYQSNQLRFGTTPRSNDREKIEEYLNDYESGDLVTVYYAPANPNQAVVERVLPAGTWFLPLAAFSMLLAQIMGMIFHARLVRRRIFTRPQPEADQHDRHYVDTTNGEVITGSRHIR
ncbi:MAG: DUF3592 domain-containing protein [Chloroflexi bacterium]|nr:DUF3592 domain-containing protein [Chloroflexota bacterium]